MYLFEPRPRELNDSLVAQNRFLSRALVAIAGFAAFVAIFLGDQTIGVRLRWPAVIAGAIAASLAYQAHWTSQRVKTVLAAARRTTMMRGAQDPAEGCSRVPGKSPPVPPRFEYFDAARLPRRVGRLRRVTAEANVMGFPWMRILHLWVFQSEGRIVDYLAGTWREFGSVHMLRSLSSLTPSLGRDREASDLDKVLADSEAEVHDEIEAFDYGPSRWGMNELEGQVVSDIQVWDRYGSYPVNSILCHDRVWKHALCCMLDRADLVTMDLAGFSQDHSGAEYEIGYLIDHFPMDRVVFLVDRTSDRPTTEEALRRSWLAMTDDSPNRLGEPMIRIFQTRGMYSGGSDPRMPTEARVLGSGKTDARRIIAKLRESGVLG